MLRNVVHVMRSASHCHCSAEFRVSTYCNGSFIEHVLGVGSDH